MFLTIRYENPEYKTFFSKNTNFGQLATLELSKLINKSDINRKLG